jgi:hypothetical protein
MTATSIHSTGDISQALSASVEQGGLVLDEAALSPEFFDLSTGLAGDVVKRFTIYRTRLAVIVPDTSKYGARFAELAREHRTHNAVRFFNSEQLARQWLANMPSAKC